MPTPRFLPNHTALLLVDLQEKLIPVMHQAESVIKQTQNLVQGFALLGLPILVTEQYPKGLGATIDPIKSLLPEETVFVEKTRFSALTPEIYQELTARDIRQLVVAGIEAHICVQQTCLDAIDKGFITGLVHNATTSRDPLDQQAALARLTQAHVIPLTTESILFELQQDAQGQTFKEISKLIR